MKAASIKEIKQVLENSTKKELLEVCLRLAKYKKENKELITFLLFEAGDLQAYTKNVKAEIDNQFSGINQSNLYFAKKSLRKILRTINKFIKYSTSKHAEVELLIYYCIKIKESGIPIHKSTALINLFDMQITKINKALQLLHEDLQYDYLKEMQGLGG